MPKDHQHCSWSKVLENINFELFVLPEEAGFFLFWQKETSVDFGSVTEIFWVEFFARVLPKIHAETWLFVSFALRVSQTFLLRYCDAKFDLFRVLYVLVCRTKFWCNPRICMYLVLVAALLVRDRSVGALRTTSSSDSTCPWSAHTNFCIVIHSDQCRFSDGKSMISPRAKVEKDASIKSFVAIVCQHLFEGCNGCTWP